MKTWFSEHKKSVLLSTAATLLPTAIGCILWNRLPSSMPIHWGTAGAVDGFSGKGFAVFALPAIPAVLNLLCLLITAADPKQKGQNKKALGIVFWIMPLLSLLVCSTVYAVALGKTLDLGVLLPLLLGSLFLIMGNYLPKVKQNSTLGIKISWTLQNEENWNKTHRFTGKLWVIGGTVMMLMILLPSKWTIPVLLTVTLILVIGPILYSFRIYKAHISQGIAYTVLPKHKRLLPAAITVLTLAVVGILMFTGNINYIFEDNALKIEASYTSGLTLSYEDMDTVTLREDFDIGSRVMGFGSARLSMGSFQNEELKDYTLYAHRTCDSMILIRSGNNWLAINAQTPEETQALYEILLEKTAK